MVYNKPLSPCRAPGLCLDGVSVQGFGRCHGDSGDRADFFGFS